MQAVPTLSGDRLPKIILLLGNVPPLTKGALVRLKIPLTRHIQFGADLGPTLLACADSLFAG